MRLKFIKLSSLFLLLFSVNVFASDTALILHSNYSDAHTNVKSQLEEDGYTVTSTLVSSINSIAVLPLPVLTVS